MLNKIKGLFAEEQGQGMTEYGLVLGVIAVGVIGLLVMFRGQIMSMFESITGGLTENGITPSTTTDTTTP
ncbi:Flp family type IVb pilin [Oceanobacillus salinisoli]|uniref:Flp family type IVb pilin n=1 Tax=Oceanobacillus salinisoli TaxID=2678611 RepID=UPI0012E172DC|nr:Flp family type IVb pilin [Oceanobacillus salinisoli]